MTANATTSNTSYDVLPYVSLPIPYTQPGRLAALGLLFGLSPPEASQARVLELGCASGGNIIPLAHRYPGATFTGIDLSTRQVADGTARIAALKLPNISLIAGDLAHTKLEGGPFDYILCHGVMSWVPAAVQDAIFRICREQLSPDGLAVISYNVLPGWHTRQAVRDICIRAVGSELDPMQRVGRARRALKLIAGASSGGEPYGLSVRSEAERLVKQPASYILGEYLSETNTPFYFREFARRAARAGLTYVCEGDLTASIPAAVVPGGAEALKALGEDCGLDEQEAADLLSGRTFRRSIFMKSRGSTPPAFSISRESMSRLHISSPLRLIPEKRTNTRATFRDHRGRTFATDSSTLREALVRLGEAYPSTLGLAAVAAEAAGVAKPAKTTDAVGKALLKLAAQGRATLSTLPLACAGAHDATPELWSFAAAEIAQGQPWMTTLRHTGAFVPPILPKLAPHLNGHNDHDALLKIMSEAGEPASPKTKIAPSREAAAPNGSASKDAPAATADSEANVREDLEKLLSYLATNAVLVK